MLATTACWLVVTVFRDGHVFAVFERDLILVFVDPLELKQQQCHKQLEQSVVRRGDGELLGYILWC